jgi:SAM-dependent methyltransferase
MDWVKEFYTRARESWGPTGIWEKHRARAATMERLCGEGAKRVLDLGAGAGGTAAAIADLGHTVVAVELSPAGAAYTRELAQQLRKGSLAVFEADFFTVELEGRFDVVCYWNGFGVGSDADQRRLLQRIATTWIAPRGSVLMDVFNPWPWARAAGQEETRDQLNAINRRDFDPVGCRLIDEWWPIGDRTQAMAQFLRCYTPADLMLLLEDTGLALAALEVAGEPLDVEAGQHTMNSPLWDAWEYLVKLVPARQ